MRGKVFESKAAVARWLHGLADRAFSMKDEGALHEAAYLVEREWDRSKFDAPMDEEVPRI